MLTPEELAKIPLFAGLGVAELDYLARSVPDIHVSRGDYVAHEGEGGRSSSSSRVTSS